MPEEKIEKIEKVERVGSKSLDKTSEVGLDEKISINKERFDQLMTDTSTKSNDKLVASNEKIRLNQTDQVKLDESNTSAENPRRAQKRYRPAPIEETSNTEQVNTKSRVSKTSVDDVIAKADQVISKIEDVKSTLASTPDGALKNSVQDVLHSHLKHIDDNLQLAMKRTGSEYKAPEGLSDLATPIERFLGMLTHGQSQLDTIGTDLSSMGINGKDLSPASMLAVQIKVNQVSQEVEFFANILSKALDSVKTIMNIQV